LFLSVFVPKILISLFNFLFFVLVIIGIIIGIFVCWTIFKHVRRFFSIFKLYLSSFIQFVSLLLLTVFGNKFNFKSYCDLNKRPNEYWLPGYVKDPSSPLGVRFGNLYVDETTLVQRFVEVDLREGSLPFQWFEYIPKKQPGIYLKQMDVDGTTGKVLNGPEYVKAFAERIPGADYNIKITCPDLTTGIKKITTVYYNNLINMTTNFGKNFDIYHKYITEESPACFSYYGYYSSSFFEKASGSKLSAIGKGFLKDVNTATGYNPFTPCIKEFNLISLDYLDKVLRVADATTGDSLWTGETLSFIMAHDYIAETVGITFLVSLPYIMEYPGSFRNFVQIFRNGVARNQVDFLKGVFEKFHSDLKDDFSKKP